MLSSLGLVHQLAHHVDYRFIKRFFEDFKKFPLLDLPDDLFLHVIGFIDGRQLLVLHGVCRRLDRLCTRNASRLRTFDDAILQFDVVGRGGFYFEFGRSVVPVRPNDHETRYTKPRVVSKPRKRQVGDEGGASFWCTSSWHETGFQYLYLDPKKKKTTWKQRRAAFKVIFRHYKPASFYANMRAHEFIQWIALLPASLRIFRYEANLMGDHLNLIELFRLLPLLPTKIKTFGLYGFKIDIPKCFFSHPNLRRFEELEVCELIYYEDEDERKQRDNSFQRTVNVVDDQLVNSPWKRIYLAAYTPGLTVDCANRILQQWALGKREIVEFVIEFVDDNIALDALLVNTNVKIEKKQEGLAKLTSSKGKELHVRYNEELSFFAFNQHRVPGEFHGALTDFLF